MPAHARTGKNQSNSRGFGSSSVRHSGASRVPPEYGVDLADAGPVSAQSPAASPSTTSSHINTAGSGATPVIQAKVTVGEPDDEYEKEADRVADRVMRMTYPTVQRAPLTEEEKPKEAMVQAKAVEQPETEGEKKRNQEESNPQSVVQRQMGMPASDFRVSRSSASESADSMDSGNMEQAARFAIEKKGPGQPVSPLIRSRLEAGTGADLSQVRIHSDAAANSAAETLGARAFTHQHDIWLGRGESPTDLQLMAHETAHVAQQTDVVRRLEGVPAGAPASGPARAPVAAAPAAPTARREAAPRVAVQPVVAPPPPAAAPGRAVPEAAPPAPVAAPSTPAAPAAAEAVELLMPEPPEGLSPADQQRLQGVERNAAAAASTQEALPSAGENVSGARQAVQEPAEETTARAEGGLAAALSQRPEPSAEIEALCECILAVIHARQPPDEESLVQSNPRQEANAAGGILATSVEGDVDQVEGNYEQLNETPQGEAQQQAQTLQSPPASVTSSEVGAAQAVPDAVPAEAVSLDADVEASAARMEQAGMASEPAQLVQSGPIAEARAAQGELAASAARDPAVVLAEQQAARTEAAADMAALQAQALEALQASRAGTVSGIGTQQQGMVGTEEQMRARIGARAQAIFDSAQSRVNSLLEPLTRTAMQRWQTGVEVLSSRFEGDLAQVQRWLDERYSGVGGAVLELWEGIVGKPDWVTQAYNRAEENFANGVCDLIREISTEVNSVIATCEQIIDDANTGIADLFNDLPAGLQEWAATEQARFTEQLNGLHQRVLSTRDEFNQNLSERAAQAVQQVRERIHELRQAAGGLVGQIQDAINSFLEDPARFIIEGLLELVGIPPASFWAVVNRIQTVINDIANDPMNFANNLVNAIGQGFQRFFDNFADHILGGFFDWLFSGLGAVGVNIPQDFSLKSIITFFLELMGITWPRIRQLLARHLGEENVALIEQAYEIIANLIEMGPEGVFEMIKEQLDPQRILDQVLQAAIEYLVETLITRVSARIIMMFNPAGAIVQAIELIYRVLRWIFDNAARIFSLVETIVNGAAALIAGNITGMATAVEGALARLIAPVIDFLAGFLGLGNLPDRIADTIRGFQEWIMGILDRVIRWLADRARSLLARLGLGRQEQEEQGEEDDGDTITEQVQMGTETHTLRIKTETRDVTLASDEGPLEQKLSSGLDKLDEYEGNTEAEQATRAIRRMRTLLQEIFAALQAGTEVDRSRLREYSRRTKEILESYGQEFNVNDIVDGLPEYGPVLVGEHRVGAVSQPDGSTRESHHVPPKELAQAIAREMMSTASALRSKETPASEAAADDLDERAQPIQRNTEGMGLSAISLHRVTHQNSGGVAVHAAAMRADIQAEIDRVDAETAQRTVQITNRASGDLAVNPSGATFDEWVRSVYAELDREDAHEHERAEAEGVITRTRTEVAAVQQNSENEGEAVERQQLGRLVDRAFRSGLTQGKAAISTALSHSILDGPQDERSAEIGKIDAEALRTWRANNILTNE